ncbi:MAG: HNH endonuclease [Salinibacterium amurskyense]
MGHIDEVALARIVSDRLQLPISASQLGNSQDVELRLTGLNRPAGLSVIVSAGLRLVFAELLWDTFAQGLLSSALLEATLSWPQVEEIQKALDESGVTMQIQIDGHPVPESRRDMMGGAKKLSVEAQSLAWRGTLAESAADVATAVFAVVTSLLPLETGPIDEEIHQEFDVEGQRHRKATLVYERSRANRAVAIQIHGTRCKVCDLDFGERYGAIGAGFVEVHHLLPVHLMATPGVVDPSKDLVPLCANCHRMAHRADPPHTPDSLRELLKDSPKK